MRRSTISVTLRQVERSNQSLLKLGPKTLLSLVLVRNCGRWIASLLSGVSYLLDLWIYKLINLQATIRLFSRSSPKKLSQEFSSQCGKQTHSKPDGLFWRKHIQFFVTTMEKTSHWIRSSSLRPDILTWSSHRNTLKKWVSHSFWA